MHKEIPWELSQYKQHVFQPIIAKYRAKSKSKKAAPRGEAPNSSKALRLKFIQIFKKHYLHSVEQSDGNIIFIVGGCYKKYLRQIERHVQTLLSSPGRYSMHDANCESFEIIEPLKLPKNLIFEAERKQRYHALPINFAATMVNSDPKRTCSLSDVLGLKMQKIFGAPRT
uniref:Uncharacterized protein n=1 Tax=Romanomermis culicivorax TaxID=13658 RepID=A0A915L1E4_ROMCU